MYSDGISVPSFWIDLFSHRWMDIGGHNRPVDLKEIVGFNFLATQHQLCCC